MGVLSNEDIQMTISNALYSSRTDEWPTPQSFFDELNAEFGFTLDPCASAQNAKCRAFYTKEQNGLEQDWNTHRVFCNPPYGKTMRDWARKCYEASRCGALVVLLAHARTDTRWFHDWVYRTSPLHSDGACWRLLFKEIGAPRRAELHPSHPPTSVMTGRIA
jgi:phage N-6-adenine-methyltransferase